LLPEYTKAQIQGFLQLVYTGYSPTTETNDPHGVAKLAQDLGLENVVHCERPSPEKNTQEWKLITEKFQRESEKISPIVTDEPTIISAENDKICTTPKIKHIELVHKRRKIKRRKILPGKSKKKKKPIIAEESCIPQPIEIPNATKTTEATIVPILEISSGDDSDICCLAEISPKPNSGEKKSFITIN